MLRFRILIIIFSKPQFQFLKDHRFLNNPDAERVSKHTGELVIGERAPGWSRGPVSAVANFFTEIPQDGLILKFMGTQAGIPQEYKYTIHQRQSWRPSQ